MFKVVFTFEFEILPYLDGVGALAISSTEMPWINFVSPAIKGFGIFINEYKEPVHSIVLSSFKSATRAPMLTA